MSLTHLPDSLLQTISSYLNEYDQRVFLVLSSEFVRLGEGISIVDIPSKTLLRSTTNDGGILTMATIE